MSAFPDMSAQGEEGYPLCSLQYLCPSQDTSSSKGAISTCWVEESMAESRNKSILEWRNHEVGRGCSRVEPGPGWAAARGFSTAACASEPTLIQREDQTVREGEHKPRRRGGSASEKGDAYGKEGLSVTQNVS